MQKNMRHIWQAKKRPIAYGAVMIVLFLGGMVVGRAFIPDYISYDYFQRILHGDSSISDWKTVFPRRTIQNNPGDVAELQAGRAVNPSHFSDITFTKNGERARIGNFQEFLKVSDTNSLLIVRRDQIVSETYLNGTSPGTVQTSMSVAKSFLSALVGIAIDEKSIQSVNDPVVGYLPELRGKISDDMTIRHLLTMSAGNAFSESGGINGDDTKAYWSPNLRQIIIDHFRSIEQPGSHMHYNDFQPQALGMILERATGKTISQYIQEKLWQPAGMEHEASWSIDSQAHGFEQSAVGVNATVRDFAKFGLLYLHQGVGNNRQIISKSWITESTHMQPKDDAYFIGWHDTNAYGYYWWGNQRSNGAYDYYARGKHGQFIYVSPATNTVIVRTGSSLGNVQDWPAVLAQLADKASSVN